MGVLTGLRQRGRTAASVSTLAVFATTLVAVALSNEGVPTTDVQLNDSGIWVTRQQDNLVGRFNVAAKVVDGAVTLGSSSFDVLQQDARVLARDLGGEAVSPIDPANLALRGTAGVSADAAVGLGGGVAAVLDPAAGLLWVMPAETVASFSAEGTEPTLTGLEDGALAVALDGTVHVAAKGQLLSIFPGADAEPLVTPLQDVAERHVLDVTAVGSEAVVLDRTTAMLHLPGNKRVDAPGAELLVLQQPGPAAPGVVFADSSSLVTQPLGGGEAQRLDAGASGTPSAPVYLAGCAYGAWAGSQSVARDCLGEKLDLVESLEGAPRGELVYRVNHDYVILNELSLGSVWLASENFELFDDWSDVLPSEGEQDEESDAIPDTTRDPMLDRDKENRPPTAEADSFGVRPGRSTILRVLDNDADPDGDALVASPDSPDTALGPVQPVYGGAALQVVVPEDASGTASFSYTVDDGRENGTDSANVRLEVHGWDRNEAPKRLRERDLVVARGAEVTARVLEDWGDPDGDDLMLVRARSESKGDEVRFTPDGTLTFRDAGTELGRKAIAITVSDGREQTEGTVWVEVLDDQQPPVARVDHAVTTVGEPVTIEPLLNDTDPNGDELRLARVDEAPPAQLTTDYDAGTVTLVSEVERVFYLTYLVTDGPSSTLGLIRVDVVAPSDATTPPVAVKDTALLPSDGSVLVDVLANDHDPAGGILVLQSVEVDPLAGLSVEVVDHHLVRITAVRALEGPASVRYSVSNGLASSVGEVLVIPVPAPEVLRPPTAHPDEAVVRAGDIVTIPVLKNDEHPDNALIELVPELVEVPDPADGLIFTTEDTIRFHAGPEARTVRAVYEIVDPQGQKDSAQVTIHVRAADPEQNSPPRPKDLEARVLAGSVVRISVPTAGLDPDGDRVTLLGLDTAPSKGRVVAVGAGWIDYEANATSTGTDSFTYRVADSLGARATAKVTVGIAPSTETNLPPVATDDVVYVRPDRLVAVPVLLNDVDPEGGQVRLVADGLELPEGLEASVQQDRVLVRAPAETGAYTLYYTIADPLGARAVGALTVDVSGTAPLRRPVALDDEFGVAEVVGKEVVDVPVLDNDDDPDGFVDELEVSLPENLPTTAEGLPVASVSPDGSVKVTLTEQAQIIPYTITDQDGLSASAFVLVPGMTDLPPALSPSSPELSVISGEELRIDLREHVVVAEGRTMGLTEAGKVTAVRGTGTAVDHQTLSYVSEADYVGPAAISFEVGDGEQGDPATQTSVLSLPITVLPKPEVNTPPTARGASLSVEAGTSESIDLASYAADEDGDELTFALVDKPGSGISVSLEGTVVTVAADNSVRKGTRARASFSVSDGEAEPVTARLDIEVTGSRAPLATVNLDRREDVHQGEPVTIDVLANDKSPFPGEPLKLLHAELDTGEGTVAVNGTNVVVTPSASFVGTLTARYTVGDATEDPDRNVDGRIEITVLGRPGEMSAPTVEGVRSKTVVLSWTPPVNNGSEITHYVVSASDGKSFDCKTTTCTLEGLTNDLEYTFTVVAHNAVGVSDPSPESAPARPDERPDPPAAPSLKFGDGSLEVTWTNATYTDRSQIVDVTLEISPAPPSGQVQKTHVAGTSLVWDGLVNGTEYKVRVMAHNNAPEPSDFSPYSLGEIPAGVPSTPGAPTASRVDTPLGGEISVSWGEPANNGDAIAGYELEVRESGNLVRTIQVNGTQQTVTGLEVSGTYTFAVRARNKAGFSETSGASEPVTPFGRPGPAGTPSASLIENNTSGRARVTWTAAAPNGNPVTYRVRANGNVVVDSTSETTVTVTGLNNGTAYRFTVEPVNAGGSAGQTAQSNAVTPYGTPPRPNVSASGGDRVIRFSWSSGGTNGRPIDRIQIKIGGGSWENVSVSGSREVSVGYSTSRTITARAVDSEGTVSAESSASATSNPAPPPPVERVWITQGPRASGSDCPSCNFFVVHTENFSAPGTYSIACQSNSGSGWRTFNDGSKHPIQANGTRQLYCYYGNHGLNHKVRVVFNGNAYGEMTWP